MKATKRQFLLALPFLALMAGCSAGSLPSRKINLNEDAVVQVGETVLLLGQGTTVQIESVLEDSRCPINAECVQAGQTRVAVRVISGKGNFTQEAKLPLLPTELPAAPASKYSVALKAVSPDRVAGTSIPAENYRFTIRVTRVD